MEERPPLNENIIKGLIKARFLIQHAISHLHKGSELDNMIVIHDLDNAVEYMLKILCDYYSINEFKNQSIDSLSFPKLISKLHKRLTENKREGISYISDLKNLHKIRNLVQHAAINPQTEINKYIEKVELFFTKTLKNHFDLNVDELSLTKLIDDSKIRELMESAQKYTIENKYLESVVETRNAFENAYYMQIIKSNIHLNSVPVIIKFKKENIYVQSFFSKITNDIELLSLNIRHDKYYRFKSYCEHIPSEHCKNWQGNSVMQRPWNEADAKFCFNFVFETIMMWQNRVSDKLYDISENPLFKKYSFFESISDIPLDYFEEGSCLYVDNSTELVHLFYCARPTVDKLKELTKISTHTKIEKHFEEGRIESRTIERIKFIETDFSLVTNDPERWRVILWYEMIPFTSRFFVYKNGIESETTVYLNKASKQVLEKVLSFYDNNTNISNEILKVRKIKGNIECVSDLQGITIIDDDIINTLSKNTYIGGKNENR